MTDSHPGRLVANTGQPARHPWPADVYVQGGATGVVMTPTGNYRTAFVEAFPRSSRTYMRGEGPTLDVAETDCWDKYQTWVNCDGTGRGHGDLDRRGYTNGGAFCGRCGTWMGVVLDPLPHPPDTTPGTLARALSGDSDALVSIFDAMANADTHPTKAELRARQDQRP